MFVAFSHINPFLLSLGALQLEYLALSCCNVFSSFSPYSYPELMREGFFFIPKNYTVPVQYLNTFLPNLCHLKLQGVHVHWSVLNLMLTWQNNVSLVSLELDYHSRDVCPSLKEFCQLLSLNSQLEILKIRGSGPIKSDPDDNVTLAHHFCQFIHLPSLKNVTLGYYNISECQTILKLLDALNTLRLHLEDKSYKMEPERLDASPILSFLATSEFSDVKQKTPSAHMAFPRLTSLSLSSVNTRTRSFNTFLNLVKNLQDLTLNSINLDEVLCSLLPSDLNISNNSILCPCPCLDKATLINVCPGCGPQYYLSLTDIDRRRWEHGSAPLQCEVQEIVLKYDNEDIDMDFELDKGSEFLSYYINDLV